MLQQKYIDSIDFWLEHLDPAEIAFVMLFLKDNGSKEVIINEGMGERERTEDAPDEDDDSSTVEFESNLVLRDYDKRHNPYTTFLIGSYSGYFSGGSPGTYWDPPEAADFNVDDVTIEAITVFDHEGSDSEITKEEVNVKNLGFTFDNLVCSAASVISNYLPGDTSKSVDKYIKAHRMKEIPVQLTKKIEEVYEKNDGFKHLMASKKYGV